MNPPEKSLFDQPPSAPAAPPQSPIQNPQSKIPNSPTEYLPPGSSSPWMVERAAELCARFALDRAALATVLPHFHSALAPVPLWLVLRRLFGVGPVIPPPDAHPDDARVWPVAELASSLGVTVEHIEAQMDVARNLWEAWVRRNQIEEGEKAEVRGQKSEVSADGQGTLEFNEDDILGEFGFPDSMFALSWPDPFQAGARLHRAQSENAVERTAFARRVDDMRRMLAEPRNGAGTLARQVLLNELYARRLEADMAGHKTSSKDWRDLKNTKAELEESIQQQHAALAKMFPDMAVGGKVQFRQCLGDLIQGHQNYYARHDQRLFNRIETVAEVEFLCRQSVQMPTARLRLGQEMAILDAMSGLWDPQWRPRFKPAVLRKLDLAGQSAIEAARVTAGEPLLDLESSREFEDFLIGGEAAEEVSREGAKEAKV